MVNLFISYYQASTPERQSEIDYCLKTNVGSPLIDKIYVASGFVLPIKSDKIVEKFSHDNNKPTYAQFINVVNHYSGDNDINIIANADIVFDETLSEVSKLGTNECWALSRWEMKEDFSKHMTQIQVYGDSQDVWIFRGKIKTLGKADFPLGKMGCISGDALIQYNRGARHGSRSITLRDLYSKFNNIKCGKPKFKKKEIPTFCESLDRSSGRILFNEIIDVIDKGVKPVLKITFSNDSELVCTPDHLIAVEDGKWIEAQHLMVGDNVICKKIISGRKKKIQHSRPVIYVKYHPNQEKKTVRGHTYNRVREQRLSYEAQLNNLTLDEFVDILKNDKDKSVKLKYTDPKLEIHHIDENHLNNHHDNLVLMTKQEHAKHHNRKRPTGIMTFDLTKVESVVSFGEIDVYDITMTAPYNNFVADRIVVHNCDNRIAYEIKKAGYKISNPSRSVHTWHLHNSNVRGYNPAVRNENTVVSQPYLNVPVTSL